VRVEVGLREEVLERHTGRQLIAGGWPEPWSNVAEIATVLPSEDWTLSADS
jgi:hypothetical protein